MKIVISESEEDVVGVSGVGVEGACVPIWLEVRTEVTLIIGGVSYGPGSHVPSNAWKVLSGADYLIEVTNQRPATLNFGTPTVVANSTFADIPLWVPVSTQPIARLLGTGEFQGVFPIPIGTSLEALVIEHCAASPGPIAPSYGKTHNVTAGGGGGGRVAGVGVGATPCQPISLEVRAPYNFRVDGVWYGPGSHLPAGSWVVDKSLKLVPGFSIQILFPGDKINPPSPDITPEYWESSAAKAIDLAASIPGPVVTVLPGTKLAPYVIEHCAASPGPIAPSYGKTHNVTAGGGGRVGDALDQARPVGGPRPAYPAGPIAPDFGKTHNVTAGGGGGRVAGVGVGDAVYTPSAWDFSDCTYTVQYGDIPIEIVKLYGIPPGGAPAWNPMHLVNMLNYPGDPAVYWQLGAKIKMPAIACANAQKLIAAGVPAGTMCETLAMLTTSGTCVKLAHLIAGFAVPDISNAPAFNPGGGSGPGTPNRNPIGHALRAPLGIGEIIVGENEDLHDIAARYGRVGEIEELVNENLATLRRAEAVGVAGSESENSFEVFVAEGDRLVIPEGWRKLCRS